jgi:hypothetical protein
MEIASYPSAQVGLLLILPTMDSMMLGIVLGIDQDGDVPSRTEPP